jgi:hypothetical protein
MTMGPNGDNSPDPRMPTELPLQQLHLTHLLVCFDQTSTLFHMFDIEAQHGESTLAV